MAQTGYTPIQLYYSTTASAVPTNTNLANGELAINITDGKLYYKDNTGTVKLLTSTGSEISPITNNGVVYINSSGQATSGSALTFDGTTLSLTTAGTNALTINTPDYGYFDLKNGTSTLRLQNNNSIPRVTTVGNYPLVFAINESEQMRLTSTGLGIGTSSPSYKLDVSSSAEVVGRFARSASSNALLLIQDPTTTTAPYIGSYGNAMAFGRYGGGESMRIDSSGNLGLGVTPSAWDANGKGLQVGNQLALGWTTATGSFVGGNAYYGSGWKRIGTGAATAYLLGGDGTHIWYSTSTSGSADSAISPFTQAMTLDASGNLGIGVTSIGSRLQVHGSANMAYFYDGSAVDFQIQAVSGRAEIGSTTNNALSFKTNNTERARIDSSGNLLVGTTSINRLGSGASGTAFQLAASGTPEMYMSTASVSSGDFVGSINFGTTGTASATKRSALIASVLTAASGTNVSGDLQFYTNNAGTLSERFRIDATGAWGLSGANYGTSGQVLTSQGSGSPPIWASGGGGGGSPGGSNTQVQYNSSGSFAGSANFTFNGTGITTGFFAPSSSSAPATGISLSSADTLGFSSASQGNGMFFKTFQIGSTGVYVNQLSIGNSINTSYYSNLYVYSVTATASQAKTSDGPGQIYSGNGNIAYRSTQVIEASSTGFTSNQYVPVGLESVSRSSGGWQPTQFPTGSFQTFTNIGVYGEAQGSSGYPLGTGFYAFAGSYYANATGFYARTPSIAPTSGSSYCYRSDIGPHVFGGNMVGYHSRVISGQGSNSNYNQTIGWWHSDETANGVGGTAARFEKAGSVVGTITLTTSATSYNTSSDPRLKDISGPVTSDEAKAFVMGLQPKQGTWKADGSRFCGFLSTDYELIDPSGVSGVAGATEVVGNLIDKDGKVINEDVVEPTPDALPEGGRWERTRVRDIYQTLEYGSAAWCANMTAHAQYLQTTIEQLVNRISALENK